jgi:hypothetical protein
MCLSVLRKPESEMNRQGEYVYLDKDKQQLSKSGLTLRSYMS